MENKTSSSPVSLSSKSLSGLSIASFHLGAGHYDDTAVAGIPPIRASVLPTQEIGLPSRAPYFLSGPCDKQRFSSPTTTPYGLLLPVTSRSGDFFWNPCGKILVTWITWTSHLNKQTKVPIFCSLSSSYIWSMYSVCIPNSHLGGLLLIQTHKCSL